MKDQRKTKKQLIEELEALRQRVGALESGGEQASDALRDSEERYRALSAATFEGIGFTEKGIVIDANQQMADILGYTLDELIGLEVSQCVAPEDRERVEAKIREGVEEPYTHRALRKDGQIIHVEVRPAMISSKGKLARATVIRDITERVKAEQILKAYSEQLEDMVEERTQELRDAQETLIRNEKLAVMGELAGGVGHELRQPLTVMTNAVYFLQTILSEADEKTKDYLDIISAEISIAEKTISGLLDLSRSGPMDLQVITAAKLVADSITRNPPPEGISISSDTIPDQLSVYVDPQQIGQVIANLITNAYQAMPHGGSLTLSAKQIEDQVHLSIQDTGKGIPPENLSKVFEPLFTTKARGVGLGLVVSKNLVEANGGKITVESQEGHGAAFTIILPASKEAQ